jgi:ammonia channel protein AmtB
MLLRQRQERYDEYFNRFGFFAFNSGSTLAVSNGAYKTAALIAVNTAVSGSTAGLFANLIAMVGSCRYMLDFLIGPNYII